MRRRLGLGLVTCLLPVGLLVQPAIQIAAQAAPQPGTQIAIQIDKADFLPKARLRYYSPRSRGLDSFSCDVKPDWDTVPVLVLLPAQSAGRKPLEATRLNFKLDARGRPTLQHKYAADPGATMRPAYDALFDWYSNVVSGFLETWESKAMEGPIPQPEQSLTMAATGDGYRILLPGPRVELLTTKDYTITEILTHAAGQEIDERPSFTPSTQGLLFTRVQTVSKGSGAETRIGYDIEYQQVDRYFLPRKIHLTVNDTLDMRFTFENCTAQSGVAVHVDPPAKSGPG